VRPTARPIVGGSAAVALLALVLAAFAAAGASAAPRAQGPRIVFPIVGAVTSWHDDFGEVRPIDHEQGNDIGVKPHTPVVAVVDGTVVTHYWGGAGWTIVLTAAAGGDVFQYIHLGLNGKRSSAFVAGLRDGQKVKQGQQIAWSGYSGNASIGFPHVEFQYHPHGGGPVDPYGMLKAAPHLSTAGGVPGGGGGVRLTARGDVLWTAGTGDGALMCLHVQHATLTNGKAVPNGRAVVFAVPTSAVVVRDGRPVPVAALTSGDLATVWSRALTGNPATAWTRDGGVAAARVQAQTAASGLQAPAT
jgi:peptidoglycan LD-endopeptidase LytH